MASSIPKQFSITRDEKRYRGTYRLSAGIVTVRFTAPDGVVRKMAMRTEGLTTIAVARTMMRSTTISTATMPIPSPSSGSKTADVILEIERRALDRLEAIKSGNQAFESEH